MVCDNCLSKESYIKDYTDVYCVKDKKIEYTSKRRFCKKCNNLIYDEELDELTIKDVFNKYNELYGIKKEDIINLRKRLNLSQSMFSKIIGCAKKTLISYEKGTSIPNDNYLIILKSLLNSPDIIDALIDSNKELYSEKEYKKIKERIFKFIYDNNLIIEDDYKLINYVLYFTTGGILKTKLMKEMFYSDFVNYKSHSNSITGLDYVKINYGPVPNNMDQIINDLISKGFIKEEIDYKDNYELHRIFALRKPDLSVFNEQELATMKKVKGFFKDFSAKEIADFSHEEKGYIETEFAKNISYKYAFDIDRI